MRSDFDKLPFIENLVNRKGVKFGRYYGKDIYLEDGEPFEYLNGAWWMYQELHNSLGFVNGGYTGLTEYNIDSVLGRGCFEHFKNAIATDGTKIGTTEKLNVSQPYAIDKINLECNDIIHLKPIKKED